MTTHSLLDRVRSMLLERDGVTEKRMFGGHCFMINGHMIGGVTGKGELILRVGPERYEESLGYPHAREMDFTGRPMRGFVMIDPLGCDADADLSFWLERGASYARSLPPKPAGKKSSRRKR